MKTTATSLLKKQHRKVEATFKKILSAAGTAKATPLVVDLANDLAGHMLIEQEIFYPAVKDVKKDLVLESYEEHACAEFALKRILATEPTDASFKARVTTLKELIEHHVEEEEEDLFPKVEKVLGAENLEVLGERMKARFEEALEEGYARVLPKTEKLMPKPQGAKTRANGAQANAR